MNNTYIRNIEKYYDAIKEVVSDYVYRSKRYHIDFALGLGFCNKEDVVMSNCIEIKRKTDRLIHLEGNLCCMLFDCVDQERVKTAIQGIKNQIEQNCNGKEIFVGVVTFSEYENDYKMLNALLDELDNFLLNVNYKSL